LPEPTLESFDPFRDITKNYTYKDLFPYKEYRNQQERVISEISESIAAKKNTLLVASNGTGKTIMALTAILPIAIAERKKIIFCSRTFTQNERVIEEAREISKYLFDKRDLLTLGVISIRGRNEMCVHKTIQRLQLPPNESMTVCADLRKKKNCPFFNALTKNREKNVEDAKALAQSPINAQELIQLAEARGVCPYFFTKMMISYAPIIVCNYQWIFEPNIRQNFLEGMKAGLSDCIIIMDECHNLPEMANEINSYRLTPYSIRQALKDLELYKSPFHLQEFLVQMRDIITDSGKRVDEELSIDPHKFLQFVLNKVKLSAISDLEKLLKDMEDYAKAINQEKLDSGSLSRDFITPIIEFFEKFLENMDNPAFFTCMTAKDSRQGKAVALELKCLDPRPITDPIFKETYATLSLSGTLNPFSFTQLLGLNLTGKAVKVCKMPPPFPKENIQTLVIDRVNTRGECRTDEMYGDIVKMLENVIKYTPKNIGIFCASYGVLEGLKRANIDTLCKKIGKAVFFEETGFTSSDNDILIEKYKEKSKQNGAVLIGVCGGRNSEGEDFPGDFMNTVVVVGIPYQRPTPSLEAKIKYYDTLFPNQGRVLAYIIPAFQRSNQACGRPVRRMDDRAMIILMDNRFASYKQYVSEWVVERMEMIPDDPEQIKNAMTQFYNIK
jgi:DNA excision repair protein ERCC-2